VFGDTVMVLFGAPVATNDSDHALRAVHMAVDMQARAAELRKRWMHEGFDGAFHVRMGINTGAASVGNFGSKERIDYTAIGVVPSAADLPQPSRCQRAGRPTERSGSFSALPRTRLR
jgi:class 3 adenylate cyclase